MLLHALRPEYLFLLLLVPVLWLAGQRLRSIERWRRWLVLGVRTLIWLLLVGALARLELTRQSKDLSVYFVMDMSDSIPAAVREAAFENINNLTKGKPQNDEAGLIVFGSGPSLETLAASNFEFPGSVNSVVDSARTDISSALRLALSAFPNDRLKRIVLMTDGNENAGSALEVARLARNNNVPIDIFPLRYEQHQDVQIDKLIVPQQTTRDTPYDLKIFLSSEQKTTGRLRIYEDGKLIKDEQVDVDPGKNLPFVLSRRQQEGGFHRYEATIEVAGDNRSQNNRALAFTNLKAEPLVLYVEGDQTNKNYLAGALSLEDIKVHFAAPNEIPASLAEFQAYDCVILSNVHASSMSNDQMELIEKAVHELGIGLIMIGGEDSFGAGGYQDTPIELALPVSMDVKQKKVLPNGALCIVLHTCEIPSGNAWARDISVAALNVLSEQDYFGLIYYGSKSGGVGGGFGNWGEFWLWDPGMQMTGNKRAMRAKIRGVEPLDMPTFDPTLELAYQGLKDLKTQAKHIVMISDGDPAPPNQELANNIRNDGITISTVAIAPHGGQSVETLENLAFWGSGNFYYPKTATELPRIFIKEASIVRRSLIFEETFAPKWDSPSEIVNSIDNLPLMHGYVVTSDKELSTVALRTDKDDPLLAHWRYGLGKTVAFTSDAKNKWASDWVDWNGYSQFWSQLVRWALREASSSNLQVNTELKGGKGKLTVDALELDGSFRNFLEFDTKVIGPNLEPTDVRVRQVGPGRYEGEFDAPEVGTYMVRLSSGEDDEQESVVSGAALSYSPEYEANRSNEEFIEKLVKEASGRIAGAEYKAFTHDLPSTSRPRPIWPWMLLAGVLLIPFDVFLRRVYWEPSEIIGWFRAQAAAFWRAVTFQKPKHVEERQQGMQSLFNAKQRAAEDRQDKESEKEAKETRKEFRDRLAQQAQDQPQQGSVFDAPKGTSGPVKHRTKETVGTSDAQDKPQAPAGGMNSLLEAKKRAKKKMGD